MHEPLPTLERDEAEPAVEREVVPVPLDLAQNEQDEEPGFFARNWGKLAVGALILGGGAMMTLHRPSGPEAPVRKAPEPPIVRVQLPPPPPPPKVPPPPPPEQKMVEQKPVAEEEKPAENKPKDEPPKAKDEPPALGTNVRGSGTGNFGLGTSGNGFGRGLGQGTGGGGSRFGWYAGQVQTRIADALRKNERTRRASLSVKVRIWPDASGRVSRAQLVGSSGDAGLDAALEREILTGLQLSEPPPAGMPMPIVLRLSARRP